MYRSMVTVTGDRLVSSIHMGPMMPFALMAHHSVPILLCSDTLFTTLDLLSPYLYGWFACLGYRWSRNGPRRWTNGLKEVQVELKLLFGLAHDQHTPICIGVTELFCLHNLVGKQLMSFLRILSMVDRPNNHLTRKSSGWLLWVRNDLPFHLLGQLLSPLG